LVPSWAGGIGVYSVYHHKLLALFCLNIAYDQNKKVSVLWVKYNFIQAVQLHLIGSGIAQSGLVCFFQI
jgi:hypothetical protein